ncbi:MAG: PrsW family intramembrane metalloprotease [Anaerolineales bacterium]|nr:PrsW family intramembrane metalloprotease [Anaerolineales bacterium]
MAESIPTWLKRASALAGLLLLLSSLPFAFGFFCVTFILVIEGDQNAISAGLITFMLMAVTLGAGGVVFWHSIQSLQKKKSKILRLPPVWVIAGIFGLLVAAGLFISNSNLVSGLLFPPILLAAATLPPLLAVSWFTRHCAKGLTWRQASAAFAGGATLGVLAALVLEIVFPAIVLILVFNLAEVATKSVEELFKALAGENIAAALTSPGFIYVLIQVAIIAPVAEELAKPLATLAVIRRLSRQDAFLVGAMAGAGFAAVENVLYAGFGFHFWAGILVVRALGGAVHPLGSGLVALGWHDILLGKPRAGRNWLACFGIAAGMHALWNGGSLLVITLAGAQFFGELPPEIDVLGLSAAGTTLALLIILGLVALWLGSSVVGNMEMAEGRDRRQFTADFTLSDRSIAIWALTCLVAIVPAGIAGLQLLMR